MTAAAIDMGAAALGYAKLGLAVFPIWPAIALTHKPGFICGCGRRDCDSPAKHPIGRLVPHGVDDATADGAQVRHLWASRPDANIGVATGKIVVVDIDPQHGGALEALEAKGELPDTWCVTTGGGGLHLYFSCETADIGNTASKLAPGIDTRGRGGYVVAPPSLHVGGKRYTWAPDCAPGDLPLMPLPRWIAATIKTIKTKLNTADWHKLVTADIPEGARNDTLTRIIGHLLRRYVDPMMALQLLLAFNRTRCCPPLADDEVIAIAKSIARREKQRRNGESS